MRLGESRTCVYMNEDPSIVLFLMSLQLLKDWKSIRRAFKKFDSRNLGVLNVTDFKGVLRSCGVQVQHSPTLHNDVIVLEFVTSSHNACFCRWAMTSCTTSCRSLMWRWMAEFPTNIFSTPSPLQPNLKSLYLKLIGTSIIPCIEHLFWIWSTHEWYF